MKAEELLSRVEKENNGYEQVVRNNVNYGVERNIRREEFLEEMGGLSKYINDSIVEIRKGVRTK